MKRLKNFSLYLMLLVTLAGISSCDEREITEYNMPGIWHTSKTIDFGQYRLAIGTELYFDEYGSGYIQNGTERLSFQWQWYNEYSYTIELRFRDGSYAYIYDIHCNDDRLSGVWYNTYYDLRDDYDAQPFSMYRVSY